MQSVLCYPGVVGAQQFIALGRAVAADDMQFRQGTVNRGHKLDHFLRDHRPGDVHHYDPRYEVSPSRYTVSISSPVSVLNTRKWKSRVSWMVPADTGILINVGVTSRNRTQKHVNPNLV